MSTAESNANGSGDRCRLEPDAATRPLHRVGAVRQQEEVTRRTVARRLKTTVAEISRQECPTHDLPLSVLYEWARILDVPVADLLREAESELSEPIRQRAKLVCAMKTARAILEGSGEQAIRRFAQTLVEQLLDIMPELTDVKSWHAVGERRRRDEFGIAAVRAMPESFFLTTEY